MHRFTIINDNTYDLITYHYQWKYNILLKLIINPFDRPTMQPYPLFPPHVRQKARQILVFRRPDVEEAPEAHAAPVLGGHVYLFEHVAPSARVLHER